MEWLPKPAQKRILWTIMSVVEEIGARERKDMCRCAWLCVGAWRMGLFVKWTELGRWLWRVSQKGFSVFDGFCRSGNKVVSFHGFAGCRCSAAASFVSIHKQACSRRKIKAQ